jgi:glucose/arabinose dehydrogenase
MRRLLTTLAVAVLTLAGLTAPAHAATTDPRQVRIALFRQWTNVPEPVAMVTAPSDTHRMFVVERRGRIRVIRDGVLRATPFLDIRPVIDLDGEGGLLSLAFRPDFSRSGFFYVTYVDSNHTLHLARFHARPGSDVADPHGGNVMLIAHPGPTNHYGGQLAFGAGGLLFVGTGDGGGSGDPAGNAQNPKTLLGKVLRIDVTNKPDGVLYAIPPGNPYATATDGRRREIWLLGLRNPWRFSFDRMRLGDLWLADVGQGDREEVDYLTSGGHNLGWDCREGTLDTASQYGGSYCTTSGYTAPTYEYDHSLGCAIIGGYVYRGPRYPTLLGGTYLYADYCSGRIWGLGRDSAGRRVAGELYTFSGSVYAFGQGPTGELYVLSGDGSIYRIDAAHR